MSVMTDVEIGELSLGDMDPGAFLGDALFDLLRMCAHSGVDFDALLAATRVRMGGDSGDAAPAPAGTTKADAQLLMEKESALAFTDSLFHLAGCKYEIIQGFTHLSARYLNTNTGIFLVDSFDATVYAILQKEAALAGLDESRMHILGRRSSLVLPGIDFTRIETPSERGDD